MCKEVNIYVNLLFINELFKKQLCICGIITYYFLLIFLLTLVFFGVDCQKKV